MSSVRRGIPERMNSWQVQVQIRHHYLCSLCDASCPVPVYCWEESALFTPSDQIFIPTGKIPHDTSPGWTVPAVSASLDMTDVPVLPLCLWPFTGLSLWIPCLSLLSRPVLGTEIQEYPTSSFRREGLSLFPAFKALFNAAQVDLGLCSKVCCWLMVTLVPPWPSELSLLIVLRIVLLHGVTPSQG